MEDLAEEGAEDSAEAEEEDSEAEDVAVVEKQSDVVFFVVIITHVRI